MASAAVEKICQFLGLDGDSAPPVSGLIHDDSPWISFLVAVAAKLEANHTALQESERATSESHLRQVNLGMTL